MNDFPGDTSADIVEAPDIPEASDLPEIPEIPETVDISEAPDSPEPTAVTEDPAPRTNSGGPEVEPTPETEPIREPGRGMGIEPPPGWTPGGPEH